jgi:very-short-patch-repair endonuclease
VVAFKHEIGASKTPGDHDIAGLADRQYGRVGGWQLRAMGFGRGAIRHRVAAGRLFRVHRDVYAVGHSVPSLRGSFMEAILACGPAAVLSHLSAARQWDLLRAAGARVHVTVPGRSRRGRDGIVVHSVRSFDVRDWGHIDGIPVTSLPRTLLDLAELVHDRQLRRALEEAERLDLLDLGAVRETLGRSPGRRGARPLKLALGAMYSEARHTKSDFEALLLELCREVGMPQPVMNTWVEGYEVDAQWPGTNVIVELDSWEFHRTREAFERDRAKSLKLEAAGYVVVRLSWRQLTTARAETAASLAALLARSAAGRQAHVR